MEGGYAAWFGCEDGEGVGVTSTIEGMQGWLSDEY
jgi:hypothetical protein